MWKLQNFSESLILREFYRIYEFSHLHISSYRDHMRTVHFAGNEACQNCGKIMNSRYMNRHAKNCVRMPNYIPSIPNVPNSNNNCDDDINEATNNCVIDGTAETSEY